MGTSAKAAINSKFSVTQELAHDIMENTIGMYTVDYGRPSRSTCTPYIVPSKLQKVKNHEGGYNIKAKNQKVKQEYQKQKCANFKACNQWTRSFFKCALGLFMCNLFFVKHKFEAVINA